MNHLAHIYPNLGGEDGYPIKCSTYILILSALLANAVKGCGESFTLNFWNLRTHGEEIHLFLEKRLKPSIKKSRHGPNNLCLDASAIS